MLINNKIIFFNPFLFVVEGHIYNAPTTTGEIFMKNINLHKNINLITIKIHKNECNYFFPILFVVVGHIYNGLTTTGETIIKYNFIWK